MKLLIPTFLFGLVGGLIVHENVVFHKENQVSVTRSKWLFTFVIDLNPYATFLVKLEDDTYRAAKLAKKLTKIYEVPRRNGFLNAFIGLSKEIKELQETKVDLLDTYMEI